MKNCVCASCTVSCKCLNKQRDVSWSRAEDLTGNRIHNIIVYLKKVTFITLCWIFSLCTRCCPHRQSLVLRFSAQHVSRNLLNNMKTETETHGLIVFFCCQWFCRIIVSYVAYNTFVLLVWLMTSLTFTVLSLSDRRPFSSLLSVSSSLLCCCRCLLSLCVSSLPQRR